MKCFLHLKEKKHASRKCCLQKQNSIGFIIHFRFIHAFKMFCKNLISVVLGVHWERDNKRELQHKIT